MTTTSPTTAAARERSPAVDSSERLRNVLRGGAALWGVLLVVGFFAPGGWQWGVPGPIGHMQNYMIGLWLVTLVLAPVVASRDPLGNTSALQVYALGVLAIVASTVRGEPPKWISDAPPLTLAALTLGLLVWAHPRRRRLLRLGGAPAAGETH